MNRKQERTTLKQSVLADIVKAVARLGTCRRSKVGCIIVKNGRIISTGYNGSPPGESHCLDIGCLMMEGHCIRTTHAESNAIAWAARYGISVEGATLYVTGWITGGGLGICPSCDKLAKSAGIKETVIIPNDTSKPRIICLCGSTKFEEEFRHYNLQETLLGNIVLSVGGFLHGTHRTQITDDQKILLDDLHKRKIDLADEVLVLNVGGYIGNSTRSEIEYAVSHGKTVRYIEPQ